MSTTLKPPEDLQVRKAGPVIPIEKLQVPTALALGRYELLTDEELNDHHADICAERERRSAAEPA